MKHKLLTRSTRNIFLSGVLQLFCFYMSFAGYGFIDVSEGSVSFSKSITQNVVITGKVIDENCNPLSGATIQAEGTAIGSLSDFYLNYSIAIPDNTLRLVFSYTGYKRQSVVVNDKTVINVQLKLETNTLSGVVVIGYGEQSRQKITGAVGRLKTESLQKVASPSLDQQISGKMSSIVVNQSNATPGWTLTDSY